MCPTRIGYRKMKKQVKKLFLAVVVLAAVVVGVSVVKLQSNHDHLLSEVAHTHLSSTGTRCNGTVGCNCPGFSPIQHQEVWKQAYCRYCGHHRNSHK